MAERLNYNAMQTLILHQNWWFTPSELHGLVSALVAGNQANRWSELLFSQKTSDNIAQRTIQTLSEHIDTALAANELRFTLLLPADTTVKTRAEALCYWVQGFKLAMSYLRERHLVSLDKDCIEFMNDLSAFAQLDTDLPESEENQHLLSELEEHCRMGALLIYAYTHTKKHHDTKKDNDGSRLESQKP